MTGCTGSLRYMAPEVALSKPYNEKVDIYGFGIIFYQIVTGVIPFLGLTKDEFYSKVVHKNFRPPIKHDDYYREIRIHEELRTLIQKCWNENPNIRPSATEIYELLESLECANDKKKKNRSTLKRSMERVVSKFTKQDSI